MVLPKIVDGRNKLFFMFNWEGLRENKSLTQTPSLPLTAWRTGDFSGLRDASGNLIPIYDPATRVFDAAGNVLQAPTQFPGNRIPANRIHPVSQKLLAYYPLPQQEITGPNFVNDEARQVNADQYTYRIDFTQGKSNWTFRHSISHELGYDPFPIPNMGTNTDTDVQQAVFSNTRTFASNKLNDIRFGFGYLKNGHISPRASNENVVKDARDQPAERQPAVLGCAQHRRHGAVGPRRRERCAVHQRRHDAPDRRQLHLDRRQAFVQVRRRAPARASTTRSAAS